MDILTSEMILQAVSDPKSLRHELQFVPGMTYEESLYLFGKKLALNNWSAENQNFQREDTLNFPVVAGLVAPSAPRAIANMLLRVTQGDSILQSVSQPNHKMQQEFTEYINTVIGSKESQSAIHMFNTMKAQSESIHFYFYIRLITGTNQIQTDDGIKFVFDEHDKEALDMLATNNDFIEILLEPLSFINAPERSKIDVCKELLDYQQKIMDSHDLENDQTASAKNKRAIMALAGLCCIEGPLIFFFLVILRSLMELKLHSDTVEKVKKLVFPNNVKLEDAIEQAVKLQEEFHKNEKTPKEAAKALCPSTVRGGVMETGRDEMIHLYKNKIDLVFIWNICPPEDRRFLQQYVENLHPLCATTLFSIIEDDINIFVPRAEILLCLQEEYKLLFSQFIGRDVNTKIDIYTFMKESEKDRKRIITSGLGKKITSFMNPISVSQHSIQASNYATSI